MFFFSLNNIVFSLINEFCVSQSRDFPLFRFSTQNFSISFSLSRDIKPNYHMHFVSVRPNTNFVPNSLSSISLESLTKGFPFDNRISKICKKKTSKSPWFVVLISVERCGKRRNIETERHTRSKNYKSEYQLYTVLCNLQCDVSAVRRESAKEREMPNKYRVHV